jgi:hypothetical protein
MARIPQYSRPLADLERRHAGTSPSVSGMQRLGIASLTAILRRYISPILLDSVLNRAIQQHVGSELPPGEMLKLVAADCMIGLRLFVSPERLPDLMLEIAELLEMG